MAVFRLLALLLGASFLVCMGLHAATQEPVWRQRGILVLKWGVVVGLAFFGVLILRRAALFL